MGGKEHKVEGSRCRAGKDGRVLTWKGGRAEGWRVEGERGLRKETEFEVEGVIREVGEAPDGGFWIVIDAGGSGSFQKVSF